MNKVRFGLKALVAIAVIAAILFAAPSIGRFVPTHMIVQPVYCGSCHPEQVKELGETTHLADFAERIERAVENTGGPDVPAAYAVSGGCQMCHNYWDNFKWYGVKNFAITEVEEDYPDLGMIQSEGSPTDIYGNAVSPYGLGSTKSYMMTVLGRKYDDPDGTNPTTGGYPATWYQIVKPWEAGFDVYKYTYQNNTYYRLDYVWSKLSSLSPGPVGFRVLNNSNQSQSLSSCGTAEKGMCHIAADSVSLAYQGFKREFPEFPNTANGSNSSLNIPGPGEGTGEGTVQGINPTSMAAPRGAGTFFQHEMAFTTAQYSAKPVKLCGACHVFKLPPMRWGGEPWAVKDVWDFASKEAQGLTLADLPLDDPFGFRPEYNDLVGDAELGSHAGNWEKDFVIRFRTPDWAHANVPCIRCHAHAGLNDKTVGSETDWAPATPVTTVTMPSPGSVGDTKVPNPGIPYVPANSPEDGSDEGHWINSDFE